MNFKGILFDLDGTLVDSLRDLHAAVNHSMTVLGLEPHSLESVQGFIGNGVRALLARSLLGKEEVSTLANDEEKADVLAQHIEKARNINPGRFASAYEAFDDYYKDNLTQFTRPYSGVIETLSDLSERNIPLAVVSNKPERFTLKVLENLEMNSFFDLVVGGDTAEHPKPHPAPVEFALKRLNLETETTLMLGDSPPDLLSGKRAGCKIGAVSYGFCSRELLDTYEPDFYLDHFSELLKER